MANKLVQVDLSFKRLFKKIDKKFSRRKLKQKVGELIIEQMQSSMDKNLPPVKGFNKFEKYSEKYATEKGVARTNVDLKLEGDMRSDIEVKQYRGNIQIGIFGGLSEKKAETHNAGTQVARNIPRRPFIPIKSRGETFKKKITRPAEQFVKKAVEKEVDEFVIDSRRRRRRRRK